MSAWSAIASKAGDFAANTYSARKSYKRSKSMMKQKHQWEVNDLKAAGLNPILSAGGSPSLGSAPPAESTGPTSALVAAQVRKLNKETDLLRQTEQIKKPVEDIMEATEVFTKGVQTQAERGKNVSKRVLSPLTTQEGRASSAATLRTLWWKLKKQLEDDPNSGWYDKFKNKYRERAKQRRNKK